MTEKKYRLCDNFDNKKLINSIFQFLNTNYDAEIQVLGPPADTVIQIRERGIVKKITGMSSAITIRIRIERETLIIEEGKAEWMNKIVSAGIGALIFLPLVALPGIGAYLQDKMIKDVSLFISGYLERNGLSLVSPYTETAESKKICPACNAENSVDFKYCRECGKSLTI